MGIKCSCLRSPPPERRYNNTLIMPERKSKSIPSPINIHANPTNPKPKLSKQPFSFSLSNRIGLSNYKPIIHNHRIQYTTNGITTPITYSNINLNNNNNNNTYQRLNTMSASLNFNIDDNLYTSDNNNNNILFESEHLITDSMHYELELHRIITFGYINNETNATNATIPLCIIELCRQYYFALKPIRRKRIIFTSIIQLNLCIDKIPKFILDESIFFFKINHNDIISLFNRAVEIECSNSDYATTINITDLHPILIYYLKQKYENNLLLIFDNNTNWYEISNKLQLISDIWYSQTKTKTYSSLILDSQYWNNLNLYINDVSNIDILNEIQSGLLKYAPSMEILWQSNPTLIPMKIFDINQYHLQNGYNISYIVTQSQNNNNFNMNYNMSGTMGTGYYNNTPTNGTYYNQTPPNADLVVLAMYNSGNDYDEFSKTSYCNDESYTAKPGVENINKLFNDNNSHNNNKNNCVHYSPSNSGCHICVNYHKYV